MKKKGKPIKNEMKFTGLGNSKQESLISIFTFYRQNK